MSVLDRDDVKRGLVSLEKNLAAIVEEGIAICEVPAPTFHERERGEFVAARMAKLGLGTPTVDAEGDVIAELPGAPERPTVVVLAHLDTVFEPGTPIKVRREGTVLHGPGIGDNSMAVAAMLWIGAALKDLAGRGTLVLAANVGEEGLGNLRGAKAVWQRHGNRDAIGVAIEGAMSREAVDLGIPSRRLQIAYEGPGGHSWRDFGRPSAIHALAALITQVDHIRLPATPKTTYNIGSVEGGRSVNTIAQDARLLLDMRSEDGGALADLERRVRGLVDAVAAACGMRPAIEVVGDRQGGRLPADHWLRSMVDQAAGRLGFQMRWKSSSTDGNVPLSQGAAAVTLGVARGDNLHALDEKLDVSVALEGVQLDYLVLAGLLLGARSLA